MNIVEGTTFNPLDQSVYDSASTEVTVRLILTSGIPRVKGFDPTMFKSETTRQMAMPRKQFQNIETCDRLTRHMWSGIGGGEVGVSRCRGSITNQSGRRRP